MNTAPRVYSGAGNVRVSASVRATVRASELKRRDIKWEWAQAAQVRTASPGQLTNGLDPTQPKTAQSAQVRQAAPLHYFLLEKNCGKQNGQYSRKPCIELQFSLPVPCLICPLTGLMALRQFESNLPPCHQAHLGSIKCYSTVRVIVNINGSAGKQLVQVCVRTVQ